MINREERDQLAYLHTYKQFAVALLACLLACFHNAVTSIVLHLPRKHGSHEQSCHVVVNLEGHMYVKSKCNLMLNYNINMMSVVSIGDNL